MLLVGFIIRIYHDARSSECQNVHKSSSKVSDIHVKILVEVEFP